MFGKIPVKIEELIKAARGSEMNPAANLITLFGISSNPGDDLFFSCLIISSISNLSASSMAMESGLLAVK